MTIFHAVSWDFHILTISKFCPIWAVQKVFGATFRVPDEKQTFKTRIARPKKNNLTFPWPRDLA